MNILTVAVAGKGVLTWMNGWSVTRDVIQRGFRQMILCRTSSMSVIGRGPRLGQYILLRQLGCVNVIDVLLFRPCGHGHGVHDGRAVLGINKRVGSNNVEPETESNRITTREN